MYIVPSYEIIHIVIYGFFPFLFVPFLFAPECGLLFVQSLSLFPPGSLVSFQLPKPMPVRWISNAALIIGVNECIDLCVHGAMWRTGNASRVYSHLMLCNPRISSG